MNKRILSLTLTGFLIIILLDWSCTKLDTTNIGSDLIPAVDNINTFADTFAINTTQGVFDDTTKLSLTNTFENYVFGKNDDPLLGNTDATLFLQLKPGFYPFYIGTPNDTLVGTGFDSVVLCLAYKGAYGDTTNTPIILQVSAVDPTAHGDWDSLTTVHNIKYEPVPVGAALSPPITINLASLSSYHLIGKGKDSVINQIRIKLTDNAFLNALFAADSMPGHAYSRDTLFRALNNGFAIKMVSGNALLYTTLNDQYTRLELHYKRKNGSAVLLDTSMTTFTFNNGSAGPSGPRRGAVADHIVRARNQPLPNPGDQEVYIQTAPGTFASLKIPQLSGYTNRIIHRAEIIMEEIPGDPVNDAYFPEPGYLYLDLVDSGTNKWKPLYYDLNPSYAYDPDYKTSAYYFPGNNVVDYSYFGGTPKQKLDATAPSGTRAEYTINITRYVQQMVTKQTTNYEMRLYAPYNIIYPQYKPDVIPYSNTIAAGRVRLGGGNAIDPKYRMRLRIIYSKLK